MHQLGRNKLEMYGIPLIILHLTIITMISEGIEGGWHVFKGRKSQKAACYSEGIRTFIDPPSLAECLKFCKETGMKYCEWDISKRDGYCYAKKTCTKLLEYERKLHIFQFTESGSKKITPIQSVGVPKQTKDPSRSLTLELGMLVSSELADEFYNLYGISSIKNKENIFKTQILTNYLKGINEVYSDRSAGKIDLKIRFTHFSVLPKSTWGKWRSINNFCKSEVQTSLDNVDATIYLVKRGGRSAKNVRLTSAGRGMTGGLCQPKQRCAMVSEVASVDTAYKRLSAHELGHVLGLIDDGPGLISKLRRDQSKKKMADDGEYPYDDMRCKSATEKSVMAGGAETWSVCSAKKFGIIFGSDLSTCLENQAKSEIMPVPGDFIGNHITLTREKLCETLKKQDPYTASWKIHYHKPAQETECKFAKGECYQQAPSIRGRFAPMKLYDDVPFIQGYKCSKGFCFYGDCLGEQEIINKLKT